MTTAQQQKDMFNRALPYNTCKMMLTKIYGPEENWNMFPTVDSMTIEELQALQDRLIPEYNKAVA